MILITGGAGYIGSVVAEKLLNKGVIIVDDFRFGNSYALNNNCDEWYDYDICDYGSMYEILANHEIDTVIHLAASANVPESILDPGEYYENNVCGTLNILRCMRELNVKKIIFSSTAAVYEDRGNYSKETDPLNPATPYGRSKLMCEQMIKDFSKAYGINYIIFRYFCVAGATKLHGESRRHETHLIPIVLDVALGKKDKVYIYGKDCSTPDGTCMRDFVHVEDIADAHLLALESIEHKPNKTYNLGGGGVYSVLNIIKTTEEELGVKIPYEFKDMREGDPQFLAALISKSRDELGWTPKHNIRDIIKSAYEWRKNPRY